MSHSHFVADEPGRVVTLSDHSQEFSMAIGEAPLRRPQPLLIKENLFG